MTQLRSLTCALVLLVPSLAAASTTVKDGKVTFRHKPGTARAVYLAGSFNGWKLDKPMRDEDGDGTWELTLSLTPGKHLYKFVVDGSRWTHDTDNPATEKDGHGGFNAVVVVGGEGANKSDRQSDAKKASDFGTTHVRKKQLVFTGEVYFVDKSTQKLPDFRQIQPHGRIYTEQFNIAPRKFSEGFPGLSDRYEWFAIRYRGTFKVEKTGKYLLRLLSDDGARLYLNGKLCLDNDGLHGPKEVKRVVHLKQGEQKLILDYMQGPALEVALQLFIKAKGKPEEPVRASSGPLKEETHERAPKRKVRRR